MADSKDLPGAKPRQSAGDLFLVAVDAWSTHAETCPLDECKTCDLLLNRMRLARKVWKSSKHKALSDVAVDALREIAGGHTGTPQEYATVMLDHIIRRQP